MKGARGSETPRLTFALAGNPNVGKSTVFNNLTGLHQHTGNWTGKTVENACGLCRHKGAIYALADLPGTYSLRCSSADECAARDYIVSGAADAIIVIADATVLERNLNLLFQIMELTTRVVLAVNLIDEAEKKQIEINCPLLSELLGIPVLPLTARNKKDVFCLIDAAEEVAAREERSFKIDYPPLENLTEDEKSRTVVTAIMAKAESVAGRVVKYKNPDYIARAKKLDRILTSKLFGIPIMLALLGIVFYLTLIFANYPSELLSRAFAFIETKLNVFFSYIRLPWFIHAPLMDGIYKTTAWVVAVMLPPMAIFFPLFTFLEDLGYLPRVAFNLDRPFYKCGCCGKQGLTMCMGFGCNAAGVVGARIIDSPRERLIAILTNNFVPCNGRFPTLIAVSGIFIGGVFANAFLGGLVSAAALTGIVLFGILATLASSKFLSKTFLKGVPSSFTLELPPFRKPEIKKILVRSLLDRTVFVLGRAVAVAAPCGLLIWLLGNITVGGTPIILHIASVLEPLGTLMGLDGVILAAFFLGLPANEIVMPIAVMSYTAANALADVTSLSALGAVLRANGWTWVTGVNMLLFTLFHFPCATTLITIKRETKSAKWTLLAAALPTALGIIVCIIFTAACRLLGAQI